jgi:hypothetical protein
MPDLDLIKQVEQVVRDRRGRFARGRSGNPVVRPGGCRDHIDRADWLAVRARRLAQSRNSGTIQKGFWPRATRSKLSKALRQRFQ